MPKFHVSGSPARTTTMVLYIVDLGNLFDDFYVHYSFSAKVNLSWKLVSFSLAPKLFLFSLPDSRITIHYITFITFKYIFISWNWNHHKWYFVTNRKKLASWIQNNLQTLSVQHVSRWHFEERKQEQSKPKGIWNIFCIFQVSSYWSSHKKKSLKVFSYMIKDHTIWPTSFVSKYVINSKYSRIKTPLHDLAL